jgi:glycosyltransferase involved in cell wall biosynthesis
MFLWQELLKTFSSSIGKKRVGFVLDVFPIPYLWVMASTRIRVYDVILHFAHDYEFFLELYRPWRKYDIVVFQKAFQPWHIALARRLKQKGTRIVLDLNTTVFAINPIVQNFINLTDCLLVSSPYLFQEAKKTFPNHSITLIEEHIPDLAFTQEKDVLPTPTTLVYAGYALKATEVLNIKNILQDFRGNHDFSILFLCEKDPKITIPGIECRFTKYRQEKIYSQLLLGDIFIAPRDLADTKNLGHSFTKIGIPMAVGLPIIASPVPAYQGSPAILCATPEEWQANLKLLFEDVKKRKTLSRAGRTYCQKRYSTQKIMQDYRDLFSMLAAR